MKSWQVYFYALIFLFAQKQNLAQEPFTLGMFSFKFDKENGLPTTEKIKNGNPTSQLNVLSQDGFNVVTRYWPDNWTSREKLTRIFLLLEKNNMKMLTNLKDWYMANENLLLPGENIYNSTTRSHPNYNYFINEVFANDSFKNIIWGHQLTEETACFNHHNFTNEKPKNASPWPPSNYIETEIPLNNVLEAMGHFRTKFLENNIGGQKMVVMEAKHGGAITQNLSLDLENNDPLNPYSPRDLIENLTRDIYFFEGSFMRFPKNWEKNKYRVIFGKGSRNHHYLGFLKTIDYAKTKVNSVYDVLSIIYRNPKYQDHFNTKVNIQNGNYLWFKAYASIIHGVKGLWFWSLSNSWQENEKRPEKHNRLRFRREHFPELYQLFIGNLSKEIRFLANNGFLNTDGSSEIHSKTDEYDSLEIVPKAKKYTKRIKGLKREHKTEKYGLRYTLRTNGEDVVMILVNPLNVPVNTTLNFSNFKPVHSKKIKGAKVLFEDGEKKVTDKAYKVNRNSDIDLESNSLKSSYFLEFKTDKKLDVELGPLDTKVLLFTPIN